MIFLPKDITEKQFRFHVDIDIVNDLMPKRTEIPVEFKESDNPWALVQADWFHKYVSGYVYSKYKDIDDELTFIPKKNIDKDKAIRHLKMIQTSMEPKHEHKQEAVAYLMSLWFDNIKDQNGKSLVKKKLWGLL